MIVPTNSEQVIKMRESLINMTNRAIKAELENEKLLEALEKIAVLYEKDIDADNYEQAANAYEMRCIARAVLENKHE